MSDPQRQLGGRISVVGNSGSGKTTMARTLAARLGLPHLELDSVVHQANWSMLDDIEFRRRVGDFITGPRWVIDGNYTASGVLDLVWSRAETVIWLDLPRPVVVSRVVRRSLRRLTTREVLWNGNREQLHMLLSRDPNINIVLWAWSNYPQMRRKFECRYRRCRLGTPRVCPPPLSSRGSRLAAFDRGLTGSGRAPASR